MHEDRVRFNLNTVYVEGRERSLSIYHINIIIKELFILHLLSKEHRCITVVYDREEIVKQLITSESSYCCHGDRLTLFTR